MLELADYNQLKSIWSNNNPWDREAFDRLLLNADSSELKRIYNRNGNPWDELAKEELIRRGNWSD